MTSVNISGSSNDTNIVLASNSASINDNNSRDNLTIAETANIISNTAKLNKITNSVLNTSLLESSYDLFLNNLLIPRNTLDISHGIKITDASLNERRKATDLNPLPSFPAIYTEFGAFNENTQEWEIVKKSGGEQAYKGFEMKENITLNGVITDESTQQFASMTKLLTSTCLYKLMDLNKIQYDDPLSKYLPTFNKNNMLNDASGNKDVYIFRILSDVSSVSLPVYRSPITPFIWDEVSGNTVPSWLLDLSGSGLDVSENLIIQNFLNDYGVTYYLEKTATTPKVREALHMQLQIPPDWGSLFGLGPNKPFEFIRNALYKNSSIYNANGVTNLKDYLSMLCCMTNETMIFFGDTNNTVNYDGGHDLQGYLITEVFNKDINLTSKISNTNNWNINEYKNLQFIINKYITKPLNINDNLFYYIDANNGPQSETAENKYLKNWFMPGIENDASNNSWKKTGIAGNTPSATGLDIPTKASQIYIPLSQNPLCYDVRANAGLQGSSRAYTKFIRTLVNMGYSVEDDVRILRSTSVARMNNFTDSQFTLLSLDSQNYISITKNGVPIYGKIINSGQYLAPSRQHNDDLYIKDNEGTYQKEDASNPYGNVSWSGAAGNTVSYNINNKYYVFSTLMNPGGPFDFRGMQTKPVGYLLDALKTTPGWSNI